MTPRARRAAARRRWRPDRVRLLLVDEAPPSAPDRHFYFEDVSSHDSLFRYVVAGLYGVTPDRDKAPWLAALRHDGVLLLDLCEEPFDERTTAIPAAVPALPGRIRRLRPDHVVLIGADVYDAAAPPLLAAGLPVVDVRLPYPGSGQQRRFAEGFALALGCAGWVPGVGWRATAHIRASRDQPRPRS